MERIQINGKWYVEENLLKKPDPIYTIDYLGCVYETDEFCWDASVIYKDDKKEIYDGVNIEFTDKRVKPNIVDNWDGTDWLFAIMNGESKQCKEAYELMGDTGLFSFREFLKILNQKKWL